MEKMMATQVKVEHMVKAFSKAEERVTTMLDNFKQMLDQQNEKHDALKREIAELKGRDLYLDLYLIVYLINLTFN
jgi:predicted transcriptional regulator